MGVDTGEDLIQNKFNLVMVHENVFVINFAY